MTTQPEKLRAQPRSEPVPETQLGWQDCPAVERVAGRMSGAWVFKNTRIPLYTVFENLQLGATVRDIASWFDSLTEGQITQVLDHQARMLREDRIE